MIKSPAIPLEDTPMNHRHIPLGIPTPETKEEVNEQATMEGMRRVIFKTTRDSAFVRHCWHVADMEGFSGEDRFTLIAYHALIALETNYRQLMDRVFLDPNVPMVFKKYPDSPL